ncbi:MAG: hypothetical protein HWE20_00655 [Gammaproteobacteria bacterium]|nr:hypothetical protein [Gammaproteobacteria bacterium]
MKLDYLSGFGASPVDFMEVFPTYKRNIERSREKGWLWGSVLLFNVEHQVIYFDGGTSGRHARDTPLENTNISFLLHQDGVYNIIWQRQGGAKKNIFKDALRLKVMAAYQVDGEPNASFPRSPEGYPLNLPVELYSVFARCLLVKEHMRRVRANNPWLKPRRPEIWVEWVDAPEGVEDTSITEENVGLYYREAKPWDKE